MGISIFPNTKNYSPWVGCTEYSRGCKNCFARQGSNDFGFRRSGTFRDLLDREKYGPGNTVYVCLNGDFWQPAADGMRPEVWGMMGERPDLNFIMMTKRVDRIMADLPDWATDADNIYFITSVESQEEFDRRWRISEALPFRRKLITVAPIQEYVDITPLLHVTDQVFVMGEMGDPNTVTPCELEWVRGIMDDCVEFDVNFDLLMAGTVFSDGSSRRILMSYEDMMEPADEFGLHHESGTRSKCIHEPSFIFEE